MLINLLKKTKHMLLDRFDVNFPTNAIRRYEKRFIKHAFVDGSCKNREQYEASITRLYHTIEKGLAYENYRPGFGKANVELLINSMISYAEKYDVDAFFYRTALSCLYAYIQKNGRYGCVDEALKQRVMSLPGVKNECGGVLQINAQEMRELESCNYRETVLSRHSIRHFSKEPVDLELIKQAVSLAQFTPSACNRQGWRTRIVVDHMTIMDILANQNGNKGFGQEIDKLLIVTGDVRCFQKNREVFQVFIDGGMYAENLINSLFYYGIGSVPLSASLLKQQEDSVKKLACIDDAEEIILFIGVGNYPEKCFTTKSERKPPETKVI